MFITAHHLVVDGVSWRILIEDLATILIQKHNKEDVKLPDKTHSFQEWFRQLICWHPEEVAEEVEYWQCILNKKFAFPVEYDKGLDTINHQSELDIHFDKEKTWALALKANEIYNTQTQDLLIAALLCTIRRTLHLSEVVLELEGHGREDIGKEMDISRTVGWFTSLYPVYFRLDDSSISAQIKEVKEKMRAVPRKGIGFGLLRHVIGDLKKDQPRTVRFNYLGEFEGENRNSPVAWSGRQIGSDVCAGNEQSFIIEINCYIIDSEFNAIMTYSKNKFSSENMGRFKNIFESQVEEIIEHCSDTSRKEFTPSDFDMDRLS